MALAVSCHCLRQVLLVNMKNMKQAFSVRYGETPVTYCLAQFKQWILLKLPIKAIYCIYRQHKNRQFHFSRTLCRCLEQGNWYRCLCLLNLTLLIEQTLRVSYNLEIAGEREKKASTISPLLQAFKCFMSVYSSFRQSCLVNCFCYKYLVAKKGRQLYVSSIVSWRSEWLGECRTSMSGGGLMVI